MKVPDNLFFSLFIEQDARIKRSYRKNSGYFHGKAGKGPF